MDYFKAKYQTIEDLPGVGPETAKKLREAGFSTVEAISSATAKELQDAGVGEATAQKAIEAARKTIAMTFIRGDELVKMREKIRKLSTSLSTIDTLLNGGLETQSITEFYGEFGSGKSQMCQWLSAAVQRPVEKGGLDGGALYIDTEHVFRTDRVMQFAESLELDPVKVLQRIIYAEAFTSQHQCALLDMADEIIKTENIRLIIVDSLTSLFRSEYLGRETLASRQQLLNKHMHKLLKLARAFDAVAVVSNQVQSTPDVFYANILKPIGGHIVGHTAHTRIFIRKGKDNLRILKIVASPFLPESEGTMRIGDKALQGEAEI